MKLTSETVSLLKHLCAINPAIIIDEGQQIFSVHPSRAVRMTAKVSETFETGFAISNLSQFLNTLALVDDPELSFKDGFVEIVSTSGNQKLRYMFSDPALIKDQPNKPLTAEVQYNVTLHITNEDLTKLNRAASVMGIDDICIMNKGADMYLCCTDKKLQESNSFELLIASDPEWQNKTIKAYFRKTNLKLTNNDFNVSISDKGLSTWVATDSSFSELIFYVSVERDSIFE